MTAPTMDSIATEAEPAGSGPSSPASGGALTHPIAAVARRLRCTEGQVYTLLIGLSLAVVLAVAGIPPALRDKPSASTTSPSLSSAGGPVATPPANLPATASAAPAAPNEASGLAPIPLGSATLASPLSPSAAGASSAGGSSGSAGAALAPTATPPPPGTITTFARVGSPGAPGGVAVALDGSVHVTTDNGTARGGPGSSHVFSYAPDGTLRHDVAATGQAGNHVDGLTGVAVDSDGRIVVLDVDTARVILVDPATATQRVLTRLVNLPPCLVALGANPCEPGVQDHNPFPVAAVFDAKGNLYISDSAQDTIWRLRPGQRDADAWYSSTDYATGDGPTGLAFDPQGRLNFTVGTSLDANNPNAGGLYRLAIGSDGAPGARTLVAPYARGDEPGALAVGASGEAYLVLRATGTIVSVGPDGKETGRVVPPGAGDVPIDGPAALAVADGRLLVANQTSGNVASHWAVLAIGITDTPVRLSPPG